MKIVKGKNKYKNAENKKGGLVKVITVQLIVCALVFSSFLAFRAVDNELYKSITTGTIGNFGEDREGFNEYLENLAEQSPVWSIIFGIKEEKEDNNENEEKESESSEETKKEENEETFKEDFEITEEKEAALAVFGSNGLLYDVDIKEEIAETEADENTLTIKVPKYTLIKIELPEQPSRPLKTANLTDVMGIRINPVTNKQNFHTGIDLGGVKQGTDVYAVMSGKVKKASSDKISGNYVILEHENGFTSCYCHLKDQTVKTGDIVENGQIIGHVGNTGQSTGTHLHFHMKKDGVYLDPLNYFNYRPYNAD